MRAPTWDKRHTNVDGVARTHSLYAEQLGQATRRVALAPSVRWHIQRRV